MAKKLMKIAASVLLIGAGILLLYLFRLQVPRHIVNFATVLGLVAGIALIAAGLFLPFILKGIVALWQLKIGKVILIGALVFAVAGTGAFGGILGSIFAAQSRTATNQSTLLVLGCQIRGSTPSRMLSDRINAAYDYLSEHPDAVAVLCGGQGADEDLSEGQCIYNILTEKGIDPARLFIESTSTTTDENIKHALAIIKKTNLSKEVAVATNDFHQKRARMICARYGLDAYAVNAKTQAYLAPVYYTREVFGVIKESV